jgi:hypothetical protein
MEKSSGKVDLSKDHLTGIEVMGWGFKISFF